MWCASGTKCLVFTCCVGAEVLHLRFDKHIALFVLVCLCSCLCSACVLCLCVPVCACVRVFWRLGASDTGSHYVAAKYPLLKQRVLIAGYQPCPNYDVMRSLTIPRTHDTGKHVFSADSLTYMRNESVACK